MKDLSQKIFINSKFIKSKSKKFLIVENPSTLQPLGKISIENKAEVNKVAKSVKQEQKKWANLSQLERAKCLHEVANDIEKKSLKPLAKIMSKEVGKPLYESLGELANVASAIRYFAEMARDETGKIAGSTQKGSWQMEIKQPLGVSAHILPFNFPILILIWTVAASLAAGNAVIIKPSEQATFTTLEFMKFFKSLPYNIVACITGDHSTGNAIINNSDVNIVSFTGSVHTAKLIYKDCAKLFKPCHLEGGGSDFMIISDKSDLNFATAAAITSSFHLSGQICTSTEHLLVHEKIYDKFIKLFIKKMHNLTVGDGLNKNEIGPLANIKTFNKAKSILTDAKKLGASITFHKNQKSIENKKGYYISPAVIENINTKMKCNNEEIFAPIVTVTKYKNLKQAVEKINKSEFGLGCNLISKDLNENLFVADNIETGLFWSNNPLIDNDAISFGGIKKSGIGRELGKVGLDTFRRTKMVVIDPEQKIHDWWYPYTKKQLKEV